MALFIILLLFNNSVYADVSIKKQWFKAIAGYHSHFLKKNFDQAEEQANKAIELSTLLNQPNIVFQIVSLQSLMRFYVYKKRYSEASVLALKISKMVNDRFDQSHIKSIENLSELADIYMLQGKKTKAILINKKVYKLRNEYFGPDHIDTLITLNNLASLTAEQGEFDLAEKYTDLLFKGYKKKWSSEQSTHTPLGLSAQQVFIDNSERTSSEKKKILMTAGIDKDYSVISKKLKQKEIQYSFKTGKAMPIDKWKLSFARLNNKYKITDLDPIAEITAYRQEENIQVAAEVEPIVIISPEVNKPKSHTLSRYPTIEAPKQINIDQEIMVMVSLTEQLISPAVIIGTVNESVAVKTETGALGLQLPESEADGWNIDVVLNASGFNIKDGNIRSIHLKKKGDSTVALFKLKAQEMPEVSFLSKIYVSYIYKGQFISRVSREIRILNPKLAEKMSPTTPQPIANIAVQKSVEKKLIKISGLNEPADLTILVREMTNADRSSSTAITIISPYLQPMSYEYKTVPKLSHWLNSKYAKFSRSIPRGVAVADEMHSDPAIKEQAIFLMNGFGKELYKKFAPKIFKEVYWKLIDHKKEQFNSIQIYTNNPVLPWELMKPIRPDNSEEHDFIGVNYNVARWHVAENNQVEEKPPLSLKVKKLFVIAPENQQQASLPWQKKEIESLSQFQQFQKIPGTYTSVKNFFANNPGGIVHFSGHGMIKKNFDDVYEYSLYLESQALDLDTWKGMIASRSNVHPLYFINSCIVGQSHRIANMVDGWAPAMLESGASGYIGALWPVGDHGASRFSIQFYQYILNDLEEHPANVAQAVKKTRKLFYETGDPTYLSYIFYGDPNFSLIMQ